MGMTTQMTGYSLRGCRPDRLPESRRIMADRAIAQRRGSVGGTERQRGPPTKMPGPLRRECLFLAGVAELPPPCNFVCPTTAPGSMARMWSGWRRASRSASGRGRSPRKKARRWQAFSEPVQNASAVMAIQVPSSKPVSVTSVAPVVVSASRKVGLPGCASNSRGSQGGDSDRAIGRERA